ncbi:MAG: RtcB family protein [Pedobacter sp.]|nr:RtcB family protein [Pedobacter sp.]MDQ8054515.1 RtcB family protein [Pedobacter sp.]
MKPITGKTLKAFGYQEGKILGLALDIIHKNFSGVKATEIKQLFQKVKNYPESFLDDPVLADLAKLIIADKLPPKNTAIALTKTIRPYVTFGEDYIEEGAKIQMETAMQLPVTAAGALMPDAHQGYGLPIGGVLATHNAIIPYGVGVDIGCRMALSIFDIPEKYYFGKDSFYKRELLAYTRFGAGNHYKPHERTDHEVLENPAFELDFLKKLQGKAASQLGTSGGGNHFVEFGIVEFETRDEELNIDKGRYVALLTHSGSRGFGATIAGHYTKLAKEVCKLPQEAANLAYLDLDSTLGQEYWIAMNLAGDYASACHEVIHRKLIKAIGAKVLAKVENHHNFAWKEIWNGEEVIVHRKGATPAGKGVMGIIPGSMTAPGFLVRGKGAISSINSASHGAGRLMSRTKAIQSISRSDMKAILKDHGVTLIGAGLDEAPMAYKDIHQVMAAQTELVEIVAKFEPKMVRMADDGSRED